MKKILLIGLTLATIFILSGCGETKWEDMSDLQKDVYCKDLTHLVEARCTIWTNIEEPTYYTQEEVDELISDLEDSFDARAMNNLNERVLELESKLRYFNRFEYEDLVEFENGFDDWLDELEVYILILEVRIDDLEDEQVNESCNLLSLLWDFGEALDNGYTFDIKNDILYEIKNGELTGDTFTNEDLIEYYCELKE